MRFDTIIIGGGLSGLVAGISLQRKGKRCAIVSAGQNALHFSSGSFELLSRLPSGEAVDDPEAAVAALPTEHPYRKMGKDAFRQLAGRVQPFFEACGIPLYGNGLRNSWRLSPTGSRRRTWLATEDITLWAEKNVKIGDKALIVNLKGYFDFYTEFLADGLAKQGTSCRTARVTLEEIDSLRTSPSEMRSLNIARVMETPAALQHFTDAVRSQLQDEDVVVLPQVFGFKDARVLQSVRDALPVPVVFAGTMPPSVPGMRIQLLLKHAFEQAGGMFLMGDAVLSAEVSEGRVVAVKTANLGDHRLFADHFILATGGYFSKGITATPSAIVEPLFGLDVSYNENRREWYDADFFRDQPYLSFGVRTDDAFRALIDGAPLHNLYAIGSILGGTDALALGCGGGVAILTAFSVADTILAVPADSGEKPAAPTLNQILQEGLS